MQTDQELRKAYGRLLEIRFPGGREACASPEEILALVEKSDAEEMRLRTLDHVMACPGCREDFELLRAIAGNRAQLNRPLRSRLFIKPQRIAWAASLVLLLGAGSLWMNAQRKSPGAVMRGDEQEIRLISPKAGARLSEGTTFVWHSLPEGYSYTLEILDQTGDVIVEGSTRDTTYTLSGALPGGEVEGLRWWVTARTGTGARTSSEIRLLGPPSQ